MPADASPFENIRVWKRGGKRAPHKPLLILMGLASAARGEARLQPFGEIKEPLARLLAEFGTSGRRHRPQFPFQRLENDGIWEVESDGTMIVPDSGADVSQGELIRCEARGGFTADLYERLRDNPREIAAAARMLLNEHFPDSLHEDILDAVGLMPAELEAGGPDGSDAEESGGRIARDPTFRHRVLNAYRRQCAVCGWDVRLDDMMVALEAAHIQWHNHGGPAEEGNGLALCSLHHKLFDYGAFTLNAESGQVLLLASERTFGTQSLEDWIGAFHGAPIQRPQRDEYMPRSEYLDWHRSEVFKEPARA